MGAAEGLLLNLLLFAGLLLLAREFAPQQPWPRRAVIGFLLILTALYVGWRYEATLPAFAWAPAALWPWLFFAGEIALIAYEAWGWFLLRRLSNHSPQADVLEQRLRQEGRLPSVDVFVPSYSEGPE